MTPARRLALPAAVLAVCCSVDRRQVQEAPDAAAGSTATGGAAGSGGASSGGGSSGRAPGDAAGDGVSEDAPDACTAQSFPVAEKTGKLDVVWVIDGSQSMVGPGSLMPQMVSDCFNIFVNLTKSGPVDLKVIGLHDAGLCLGHPGGLCGGTIPSNYVKVPVAIGETDALAVISSSYPSWKSNLRSDADAKVLVVVSDNNSSTSGQSFVDAWLKLESPPNSGWIYAALVTHSACSGSVAATEYMSWIGSSGGILGDLCSAYQSPSPDPDGFGNELGKAVLAIPGMGCRWEIPTAPPGFDKKLVKVAAGATTLAYKASSASCGSEQAWYFDSSNAPTHVVACPALCSAVRQKTLPSAMTLTFLCE